MTKTTTFSTTPTSNSAECFVWRGWLKMDALVRAEMRFDTMRGGEGMTTPVFQLAQSRPRSYGASVLHAMVDGEALCGRPTPEFPDEGCRVVAFWTSQEDDAPKCKRCLKRSADPTLDRSDDVRLPRRFFDDHESRDLPTPPTLRETKRHVWVDPYADPAAWAEFISDVLYYAQPSGPDGYPEMNRAARSTLAAIEAAAANREGA